MSAASDRYQRIPGSARHYIDKTTGEILTYRQRLNQEAAGEGYKNYYQKTEVNRQKDTIKELFSDPKSFLSTRLRAYVNKLGRQPTEEEMNEFIARGLSASRDREKKKGGALDLFFDLYANPETIWNQEYLAKLKDIPILGGGNGQED